MFGIRTTRLGLLAVLLLGYLLTPPDEGTAATKRTKGNVEYNWKVEVGEKFTRYDPLPFVPIEDHRIGVADSRAGSPGNPGPTLSFHTHAEVIDPNPVGLGLAASLDVFHDGPGAFPAQSFHHLTVEFTQPGLPVRGSASAPVIQNDPSSPGTTNRQFWEADTLVQMPGGPSYPHTLIGEVNPDQPGLSFTSLQIIPGSVGESFFDVFVEISFDGSAPLNSALPVFWFTTTAQVPEPGALTLLALTGLMGRRRR